jgi:hypothetical protein
LAPNQNEDNLSSSLQNISGLAAFAGFSTSSSSNSELIARETIKSFKFFKEVILPQIKLEDIHAIKKWDHETNKVIYDKKIFDESKSSWVRVVNYPQKQIPSAQESFRAFDQFFDIFFDKETKFTIVSVTHYSPIIAKQWTEVITNGINQTIRAKEKKRTLLSIEFLNNQTKKTNLSEIKDSLFQLTQQELKKLMIIESNDDYVYQILEPPTVPELKSSPNRKLIMFICIVLGSVIGLSVSIIKNFYKTFLQI